MRFLPAVLLVLVTSGCDLFGDDGPDPPYTLTEPSWVLQSIKTESGTIHAPRSMSDNYTVHFGEDGQYSGRSYCQSIGGRYKVVGDEIELSPPEPDRLDCSLNQLFSRLFTGTYLHEISDGDELVLRDSINELVFEGEREPPWVGN